MKAHLDIKHFGTLGDEDRTDFKFDPNSTAFLMATLTDLYADPALAVIREYSTNAIDSHRAAGNLAPIQIETPSALRPVFICRDFGVGMSADELRGNYTQYGWSSKRETNEEVGVLGLGCKSGLAYTGQFTVKVVKDGHQTHALVTRKEDGGGVLQVLAESETLDSNGVTVEIPVASPRNFVIAIKRFFSFWEPGTVLIDGQPAVPVHELQPFIELDPTVRLYKRTSRYDEQSTPDTVIMGNVPYPVPDVVGSLTGIDSYTAVIRVPIGAVNFAPNRESLTLSKRTTAVLDKVKADIAQGIYRVAQKAVDDAPDKPAALLAVAEWGDLLRAVRRKARVSGLRRDEDLEITYLGEKVPDGSFVDNHSTFDVHPFSEHYGKPSAAKRVGYLTPLDAQRVFSLIVTENGANRVGYQLRERIQKYCTIQGLDTSIGRQLDCRVLVSPEKDPGGGWLSVPTVTAQWLADNVEIDKKSRDRYEVPRTKFKLIAKKGVTRVDQLPLTVQAYCTQSELPCTRTQLAEAVGDDVVVLVAPSSLDAFVRHNPQVPNLVTSVQKMAEKWWTSQPAAARFSVSGSLRYTISHEVILSKHTTEVTDPILKRHLESLSGAFSNAAYSTITPVKEQREAWRTLMTLFGLASQFLAILEDNPLVIESRKLAISYPLLHKLGPVYSSSESLAVVEYVNALYRSRGN